MIDFDFDPRPADNFIVENIGPLVRLVGDLLDELEHEQLANGQGGRLPIILFKKRWEPISERRHVCS